MILGCDAAGVTDDGAEVVAHAVLADAGWTGDETPDPKRSLRSERFQGRFADEVVVRRRNLVPKPAEAGRASDCRDGAAGVDGEPVDEVVHRVAGVSLDP